MQRDDWERLAAALPCVIYRCRPGEHGEWLYVSKPIERLLGYSAEEWMADPTIWPSRIHPDDRERVVRGEDEAAARGAHYFPDAYRLIAKDGSVVWVSDDAALIRTDEGLIWEGVMVDITPVRLAEETDRRRREQEAVLAREQAARQAAEDVAHELQKALLPDELPDIPGLELAARYRPAEDGAAIGGDFWDVVELADGSVALAIGDVTGAGPTAAAVMGQVRNAFRAYALEGHGPAAVLARVGAVLRHQPGRLATMFTARLDLDAGTLQFASAGHLSPLLVGPDGAASLLESAAGPPLGVPDELPMPEALTSIEPGSLLLLVTDGFVAAPDLTLADGMRRLAAAADEARRRAGDHDVEHCADAVLEALGRVNPADDAALLAVGIRGGIGPVLDRTVPARQEQLAPLRRTVGRWLRESGADRQENDELTLACGEVCANVVEHAHGPGDATFRIRLERVDGTVRITVRDAVPWREAHGTDRGNGLRVAREMCDGFDVVGTDTGTTVTLTRRLGGRS